MLLHCVSTGVLFTDSLPCHVLKLFAGIFNKVTFPWLRSTFPEVGRLNWEGG